MCPFGSTGIGFCGWWEGWVPVNRFNRTSWMTVVTPTDRPKSVRNCCVIGSFGGVFVLSISFRIFCWYGGFCHRTESDLLFLLKCIIIHNLKCIIYTLKCIIHNLKCVIYIFKCIFYASTCLNFGNGKIRNVNVALIRFHNKIGQSEIVSFLPILVRS